MSPGGATASKFLPMPSIIWRSTSSPCAFCYQRSVQAILRGVEERGVFLERQRRKKAHKRLRCIPSIDTEALDTLSPARKAIGTDALQSGWAAWADLTCPALACLQSSCLEA